MAGLWRCSGQSSSFEDIPFRLRQHLDSRLGDCSTWQPARINVVNQCELVRIWKDANSRLLLKLAVQSSQTHKTPSAILRGNAEEAQRNTFQ